MSYFVVNLTFAGAPSSELMAAEQARLAELTADKVLMWSGPFRDGRGGMAILRTASEEEARSLYASTPLAVAEAITWDLRAWDGRAGVVATTLDP